MPDYQSRINLLFYLFFTVVPSNVVCFFPVGLSSLIWNFQQVLWVLKFLLSPGLGSWQLEFKSLIIVIVGFQNFVCCLVWAVYLGVQITDEGRSLYIGSKIKSPDQATKKFWKLTITIISYLNSNCQLPKPGDKRNFNTHKTCWKCLITDERPTGKNRTTFGWDDSEKIGKIIN